MVTSDTQLFAISTSKAPKKNLNNLQKHEIFKTENTEFDGTHPIGKTMSIYCYCESLSGYRKKADLFAMSCIPMIHDYSKVL